MQKDQLEEYWTLPTSEVIDTKERGLNEMERVGSFAQICY